MNRFWCLTLGDFCEQRNCEQALRKFDNGKAHRGEMPCGENWLDLLMECSECGHLDSLKKMSLLVCRECRRGNEVDDGEGQSD